MRGVIFILWSLLLCGCIVGCTNRKKLKELDSGNRGVDVYMADDWASPVSVRDSLLEKAPQDRIAVTDLFGEVLLMDAVKDEESGEMVATDRLQAVVVEAKFRNVPERNGYVNIAFEVTVPNGMQSSDWQVRLAPRLHYLGDTLALDKIYITGEDYRAEQLRGYELYNKFLNSIIPDSCNFIDIYTRKNLLEIFIERNFKELAALKNDTTIVDSISAASLFGVTQREAIEHYTKQFLVRRNNRKLENRDKMYAKYVKTPMEESGVRLDSVISSPDGTIRYYYVQSIKTCKDLRKVDMVMDGAIYKAQQQIYAIPQTEPLTYYISSMTFFANNETKYIKRIVERNAVANTAAYIDFRPGDYTLCDTLHDNRNEIRRIRNNVRELMENKDYIIDSLLITASCSPEGTYSSNIKLAEKRAQAIKEYFVNYIRHYRDSIDAMYWDINMAEGSFSESVSGMNLSGIEDRELKEIGEIVKTRSIAEYWVKLENLIRLDSNIVDLQSVEQALLVEDLDVREKALSRTADYPYIRSVLYPLLRTVRFDFYLHRRGMIKDTVHTTEIDTLYMQGVEALRNRDYEKAVTLLRGYGDLNSAVAYICMDYNNSARAVLETLPKSGRRDYMLAVAYSRLGEEQKAVEFFIHAVEQDASMRHRGNLDPEISSLIKKFNIGTLLDKY